MINRTRLVASAMALPLAACSTAGSIAVGTVKTAGGVATSAAVTGAKVTAKGTAAGARAIASSGSPGIRTETLAHRVSLITGEDPETLDVRDTYTDGPRTDFFVDSPTGDTYRCFVVEMDDVVSDAMCVYAEESR